MSHASLILGTLPILVALASVLFLSERLKKLEWGVLLLSPMGALLAHFLGLLRKPRDLPISRTSDAIASFNCPQLQLACGGIPSEAVCESEGSCIFWALHWTGARPTVGHLAVGVLRQ